MTPLSCRMQAIATRVVFALCVAGTAIAPVAVLGADMLPPLVNTQTRAAVKRGLDYLARAQRPDGSWQASGSYARQGGYACVMTSLAGLALLADGNTPVEGPYAIQVRKAADFVMRSANAAGVIAGRANTSRQMYGHGFSMLFLAEVYGMQPTPATQERIRKVLEAAVQLTVRAQSDDGGWNYRPDSGGDEGSVTVTQIQGLRACRNAGIKVPKSTIDRACTYIQNCSQSDGGIAYRLGTSGTRPAITAAAVATMYNAGEYENPVARGALQFTINHLRENKSDLWQAYRGHSYYGLLYAGQSLWFAGDELWREFFPLLRNGFLERQEENGSWVGDSVGPVYGTAIATLLMQMPNQYLPILQR